MRLRGPARLPIPPSLRCLPSSLVPRSSVQAAPRPSGSLERAATPRWPTRAEWVGCAIVGTALYEGAFTLEEALAEVAQ